MWWLLGLLAIVLATWGILSTRGVVYPQRLPIPPPDPLPPSVCHHLLSPDGSSFDVWVLDAATPRGRVLLCHGYYANHFQMFALAQGLRVRGYEVLLFELRGHGVRPGPCTLGIREAQDAAIVLSWAKTRDHGRTLPVAVIGWSMGAVVAALVAGQAEEIRAVVTDSAYSRLFPVLKQAIRRRYHLPAVPWAWLTWWGLHLALGRRLSALDPAHLAAQRTEPLLAIHGGSDVRVEPRLGEELVARWAGPRQRWLEATVGHVGMFARDPEGYCNRVVAFLQEAMA